ncbi:sugar phosphate nucleotidyltransferase [Oceanicaulis sp.]|uniref:sugar phosphate nucleotidyltransferase n=1 Tax=Oceanicaulis sp. TaxID=1924941 RepID=UPI003BAC094B
MTKVTPVILCGGGGTRLWPLSTPRTPKQFLPLTGPKSMVAETLARVSDDGLFGPALAIGSSRHRDTLQHELPGVRLVLEPMGRNSAPAIAAAALLADPDEILLILPADHHIKDVAAFHRTIRNAQPAACEGQIVTFGIKPDFPATGYGYIEALPADSAAKPVARFVEKPDVETARTYIETGRFYWNAGIFMFTAQVMREALAAHAPDILESVEAALTEDGQLDRTAFSKCRSESIDYAVMEAADNISVLPASMGWSDVGDFRAVHALHAEATHDPVVLRGAVVAPGAERVFIQSSGPKVAVHGLDAIAVIATRDAVLVSSLDGAAGIKPAVSAIQTLGQTLLRADQRQRLGDWLWNTVMPGWAARAIDPATGGFVEGLDMAGEAASALPRRGRVAPRQLFSFARAKQLGWNPEGAADAIIEAAIAFLNGPARAPQGGWAHGFDGAGQINDPRRDFYDHAFVALAGAELAALGDPRGQALAEEAFTLIDELFADDIYGGWVDHETGGGGKLSNPHMHLLEASLRYYEVMGDSASADRIQTIATLFERFMFAPETGAVLERFGPDWTRIRDDRIEPGHCYEWIYLLSETDRLVGRDCGSWLRRIHTFTESNGIRDGMALNMLGNGDVGYRLWPQLERLRTYITLGSPQAPVKAMIDEIHSRFLNPGPAHGWVDRLDQDFEPAVSHVPASMIYHLMTGIAPFVARPTPDR